MIIAVLAGGRSSRMGRDKALLRIDEETLLERTCRLAATIGPVLVVGREKPMDWRDATIAFVVDPARGDGPLSGLHTALEWAIGQGHDALVLVPCDLPRLTVEALRWIATTPGGEHGMASVVDDLPQPLASRYRANLVATARAALDNGQRSLQRLIAGNRFTLVPVPGEHHEALRGINTAAEAERLGIA